jgi:phasin family protein
MGRSTDQLGRTLGLSGSEAQQATERSARNAETILYSTTAVIKGMSGMSREYFEFVRHQIENSIDRTNEVWRCRTPQDVAAVQSDLVRDTVESVLESSRRMADMSLKLAEEAAKHMTQRMERLRRVAYPRRQKSRRPLTQTIAMAQTGIQNPAQISALAIRALGVR